MSDNESSNEDTEYIFRQKTFEEIIADVEAGLRMSGFPEDMILAIMEELRCGAN